MEVSPIILALLGIILHELDKQNDKRKAEKNWKFSLKNWFKNRWIENLMTVIAVAAVFIIGDGSLNFLGLPEVAGVDSTDLLAILIGFGGHSLLLRVLNNGGITK